MWEIYKTIEEFFGIDRSNEDFIKKTSAKAEAKKNVKAATNEAAQKAEKETTATVKNSTSKIVSTGVETAKTTTVKEIKKAAPEIEKAATNQIEKVSVNLISKAREALGLGGSNDAMREDVGKLIPRGIASGIEKNSDEAIDAFKELLSSIDYQRTMDIISEDEYYAALETLRDEYFVKGTDKWLYYTGEIYSYQKKLLEKEKERYKETYDEIFEYASDKIDEIIKKQSDYQDKLQSYGRVFQKNTILLDDGDIEFYSLGDLKTQNAELERYASLMLQAKDFIKKSGLSDDAVAELLKDIGSLPVHSASTALEALIKSPLSKSWLQEYEKRVQLSKVNSNLYYQDEMDTAVDEGTAYMKEKLSEAGYEIPENFFDVGKDAAIKFGEGFSFELGAELEKIKSRIEAFSSGIEINVIENSGTNGKNGDEINTTNYYITAALKEDAVNAIKRFETIKRLGGY